MGWVEPDDRVEAEQIEIPTRREQSRLAAKIAARLRAAMVKASEEGEEDV